MTTFLLVGTVLMAIVCGALTFRRLDTLFTENPKGILTAGICLTTAYVLLIPPIYETIDRTMPVPNGTDMLSKFFALVAVAFLGGMVNRVFQSARARRWVSGPQGAIALATAATAIFGCFVFTEAPLPSPQLVAYSSQPSIKLQTGIMLAYIAYVIAPFIVPAFRDSRSNPLRIGRSASALLAIGFSISFLRAVFYPLELLAPQFVPAFQLISFISTLFVVLGLALWRTVRNRNIVTEKLGKSALSID